MLELHLAQTCRNRSSHLHICRSPSAKLLFSLKSGAVPPEHLSFGAVSHEVRDGRPKPSVKIADCEASPPSTFRTKWTYVKKGHNCTFLLFARNHFCTKWTLRRRKLRKKCNFYWSRASHSHEMDVGRQKLSEKLRLLEASRATLSHEMDVARQKLSEKWRLYLVTSPPLRTKWTLDIKN